MPKGPKLDYESLIKGLNALLINGPATGAEIIRYLGVSQSTLSRIIKRAGKDVLSVGKARKTRYALRRQILEMGAEIPLFRVNDSGKTRNFGTLIAVFPSGFYFNSDRPDLFKSRFFDDLPYFLEDLRPAGFLGGLIPKKYPDLDLPNSIDEWSVSDSLRYITRYGSDLIGDFIAGKGAFHAYLEQHQRQFETISLDLRKEYYPKRAVDVLRFGDPGSSAGGEQPKFTARVGDAGTPVLVKFSLQQDNAVGKRTADLLVCEHLALNSLRKVGILVSDTELLICQNQFFLQVTRFDRVGDLGRRGLLSMRSVDNEYSGVGRGWVRCGQALSDNGVISREAFTIIRKLNVFGGLIANSDMHLGNLSFYFSENGSLSLAPVYDMLPMLYSPQRGGELIERDFAPPLPRPEDADIWPEMWDCARGFWANVSDDNRVSVTFRQIAKENSQKLEGLRKIGGMLPS